MEAGLWDIIKTLLQYLMVPLVALGTYMFKKQDKRIEQLEHRTNEIEKAMAEIRTELRFISRDIAEIKNLMVNNDRH